MDKQRLIIVEGPQGTGKTTLTNYLRDNMSGSNLYRLSGQKDKGLNGKNYSIVMYNALINYLKVMENIPMDLIFDRTFFTEEVYARLGYKDYDFSDVYKRLVEKLTALNYDIYFISLYLQNVELFEKRLKREYHHNYQSFSPENSINQQNEYHKICTELQNTSMNVVELAMDDFDVAYQKVDNILKLKRK
jgi:deoxyadenosine/deoxycytidine kinase